jgi:hypothetical protein
LIAGRAELLDRGDAISGKPKGYNLAQARKFGRKVKRH